MGYRANVGQKRQIEQRGDKERSLKIGKDLRLEEYIRENIETSQKRQKNVLSKGIGTEIA